MVSHLVVSYDEPRRVVNCKYILGLTARKHSYYFQGSRTLTEVRVVPMLLLLNARGADVVLPVCCRWCRGGAAAE
jgi:hypothetical protein